jgi:ATP-dependent 26S proteasome regulatory subunit
MRRSESNQIMEILGKLTATGEGSPAAGQKTQILLELHARSPEVGVMVMGEVFGRFERMEAGLKEARGAVQEMREKFNELLEKTWYVGIFVEFIGKLEERNAMVFQGSSCRVVGVCGEVKVEELRKGCEVLLNKEMTSIVKCSPRSRPRAGQIATVVEKTGRGTVILKSHEEDVEAELSEELREMELKAGDRVRWEPAARIALDRVEESEGGRFSMGEVPKTSLAAVGGQDENVTKLMGILTAMLVDAKRARDYGLSGRASILLVGPPGCGKTLMVRAAVAEIARMTGKAVRFFIVKPSEWESCLVGNTEKNIRTLFANLREATKDGSQAVLFLDEVDSIGRVRGHTQGYYSDKALNALLTELDGFAERDGVAVVATTNRKDLIDSALQQRLSDHEIHVGPPDMKGAKAIFGIHLRATLPFNPNGQMAEATRREMIETAVSRIYHPNSPVAQICRLKFNDGKTRMVMAKDLACGRLIQQICGAAQLAAYQREMRGGMAGLTVGDIEEAIATAIERLATNITVHNARNQLHDLPTDLNVISVEPVVRRVSRAREYLVEGGVGQ